MNFQANTVADLLIQLDALMSQYRDVILNTSTQQINEEVDGKWSIYQIIDHVDKSNRIINIGYKTPRFLLKLFMGTSAKGSVSTEEVIKKYQAKLEAGAKSPLLSRAGKSDLKDNQLLLKRFNEHLSSLKANINKWKEEELNSIRLPHPILGKLTGKEMLSFTVYHLFHHMKAIQRILEKQ